MDFITIIGALGTVAILLALVLCQTKKLQDDHLMHHVLHCLGGSILIIYAMMIQSWPFAIFFIAWTALSIKDFITAKQTKTSKWIKK